MKKICNLHNRNSSSYILTTFILRGDLDRFNPIAEEKMYTPLRRDMAFQIIIIKRRASVLTKRC